ncbi:MAG: hypothetical protein V4692_01940 [Bdellovibrionota bacterium]
MLTLCFYAFEAIHRDGVTHLKLIYLPQPLLEPARWEWPKTSRKEKWCISLRLATEVGGPLRRYFEEVVDTGPYAWWDDSEATSNSREFVFSEESKYWLERGPEKVILEHRSEVPPLAEIASIVFPDTRDLIPELDWHRHLKDYQGEIGERPSLQMLRYFAGFLRKRFLKSGELEVFETAGLEWARVSSLFSIEPIYQPNTDPSAIGRSGEVTLNNTAHFVQLESKGILKGVVRAGEKLNELDLNWQQAAMVDELSEDGILERTKLLNEVAEAQGPLKRERTEIDALEELERLGFVIGV